jgi:hypothetical protein
MRWKISHDGHDPRQIDLLAAIALLVIIASGLVYYEHRPESPKETASFIVPGQGVRW